MGRKISHSGSIKSAQQVCGDYQSTKRVRRGPVNKLSPMLITLKYGNDSVRLQREAEQRRQLQAAGEECLFRYPVFIRGLGTFVLITGSAVGAATKAYSLHYPHQSIPPIQQVGAHIRCGDVSVAPALEPYSPV